MTPIACNLEHEFLVFKDWDDTFEMNITTTKVKLEP